MCSWTRLWGSLLVIGGLMMLLSQGHGSAGDATTPELPYQSAAPTVSRSFLLYGGAFQAIDLGQGVCAGQCAVANALTGDCTCPSGYTPVVSARLLIDVTSGTCGSFLYMCLK
jgi:hypothetical protein